MSTTTQVKPTGPAEIPGHESVNVLTLTKQQAQGQALEQYHYDPAVIDKAVMLGDMKQMDAPTRLAFYRAVCLSAGLNPLTQPFTALERQDKTVWLYANSTCAQQLAKIHKVSYRGIKREQVMILGEPFYRVEVEAYTQDGRSVPSQSVVSLTKKKRVQKGTWPDGNPKFVDALDGDGEPVLIPLRGESLANAMMKADTKSLRRATLALIGLGWVATDADGQHVTLDLQTGEFQEPPRLIPTPRLLDKPAERAKTRDQHIADLTDQPPQAPRPVGLKAGSHAAHTQEAVAVINALHAAHGYEENWIRRYWAKMLQRFQVAMSVQLAPEQLQGLYDEAVQVYAKQAARNASQTDEKAPGLPQDAALDPPEAATHLGAADGLPDDSTPDAWRETLAGLLPDLQDMTLLHEAQSVIEDPEVGEATGQALVRRVVESLQGQVDADAPF